MGQAHERVMQRVRCLRQSRRADRPRDRVLKLAFGPTTQWHVSEATRPQPSTAECPPSRLSLPDAFTCVHAVGDYARGALTSGKWAASLLAIGDAISYYRPSTASIRFPARALRAPLPTRAHLEIVGSTAEPPAGDGCLHEIKHDGPSPCCRGGRAGRSPASQPQRSQPDKAVSRSVRRHRALCRRSGSRASTSR
jgi:hypothetical protein